jgi:site-specific DNA-methyltransferase (adenine-specific)
MIAGRGGNISTDPWAPWEVAFRLRPHFVLQNVIIWVTAIVVKGEAHGHYRPIGGKLEYIFHFTKFGDVELDRLAIGVP